MAKRIPPFPEFPGLAMVAPMKLTPKEAAEQEQLQEKAHKTRLKHSGEQTQQMIDQFTAAFRDVIEEVRQPKKAALHVEVCDWLNAAELAQRLNLKELSDACAKRARKALGVLG